MANARKILIADPDLGAVRALARALRQRGYHVQHASDGAKALQIAVLRHPDVVLFDERCALVDAAAFAQILESNPRTADVPILLTARRDGAQDGSAEGAGGGALGVSRRRGVTEVLSKPLDVLDVLARVDHLARRVEAARELRRSGREIEGSLSQLPPVDLLQLLAANRRTGTLALDHGADRGEISLAAGRTVNARLGRVEGTKALFRLLAWRDGHFAFGPGPVAQPGLIEQSTDELLIEGMRQVDERSRLLAELPPLERTLEVAPAASPLVEPSPVTTEILHVLAQPRRLGEVLDLVGAADLDVLAALSAMLQRGVLRVEAARPRLEGPLLGSAEVHALRSRVLRGRSPRAQLDVSLLVCVRAPQRARRLLRAVPGLRPAAAELPCLESGFGTLGELWVSELLRVCLRLLPTGEEAMPLWQPFGRGALGALVLDAEDQTLALARHCGFELALPLALLGGLDSSVDAATMQVPAMLRGAPAGVFVVRGDAPSALRALLLAQVRLAPAHGLDGAGPPGAAGDQRGS